MSAAVEHLSRKFEVEFPDGIARCIDTVSAIRSPHNWWPVGGWESAAVDLERRVIGTVEIDEVTVNKHSVVIDPDGVLLMMSHSVATFDGDEMTRLVIAAHRHQVRVEIAVTSVLAWPDTVRWPVVVPCLQIRATPRLRSDEAKDTKYWLYEGHPDLDHLISRCTKEKP